jgi:chemotaxis protein methyltransferase CheR
MITTPAKNRQNDIEAIEAIEYPLLLEAIYRRWGYDFRDYAPASLLRRLHRAMHDLDAGNLSRLQEMLLRDAGAMARFLDSITVEVTAMFRDPSFYQAFRAKAAPLLKPLPLVRVWHAGCSSGEEVYSLAIVLHETGLLQRAKLYATDLNARLLERSKEAIVPLKAMRDYTANYRRAGGTGDFSDYYTAKHGAAILQDFLRGNIVWAEHNLAQDRGFNEFHVILCRNVIIYFNRTLQERVHGLLYESLAMGGVLGLGRGESLQFTPFENRYETLDLAERLYRKIA